MFQGKRILCLIPARGGSKGIPHKNLQKVGGRSLVEWALAGARGCKMVDRILVSSDDSKIRAVANRIGKYAPFVRPSELAQDETPSLPVFQHALKWAEREDGVRYDFLLVLEPTCPFRLPVHVLKALETAGSIGASSVMSLVRVSDAHPVRIKKLMPKGRVLPFCIPEPEGLRRQNQEPAFIRNGAVYVFPRKSIMNGRLWGDRPFGFEMERDFYSINIDEPVDLLTARAFYSLAKKRRFLHKISPFGKVG